MTINYVYSHPYLLNSYPGTYAYSTGRVIYTSSTLILRNSLNYHLIDTKLGTMIHLLILYYTPELNGQNVNISVAI